MKFSILVIHVLLLLIPGLSFSFFCPTNFAQINYGDSIEQVTKQCGKPDVQTESNKPKEEGPQEWSYYVPQTVAMNGVYQQAQGTLKTEFSFDASGKAINISVNGIGVGSTTICNGRTVQLGDSRDQVEATCGKPSFKNKQDNASPAGVAPTQQVKFLYKTNPPVTLVFENGKLTASE